MNANVKLGADHPHFVHIPDPNSEGVRAYREPEQPHPLQLAFIDHDAERAWVCGIADLLCSNRFREADARLSAELAGFEGKLARLCKSAPAESVSLQGWEDLSPILAEWEGPTVTAMTIGMTNPADLVFGDAGVEPELLIGLYSDEAYPFSATASADLLQECSQDMPRWIGAEEDVEFYCTLAGLAELNGALINWKHRHYLRDGRDGVEGRAPGGYVEYVLASWFMATRFLAALNAAVEGDGMPNGCRIIAGTLDMNADFVTLIGQDRAAPLRPSESAEPAFATLTVKPWVRHEEQVEVAPPAPATLRQRILASEQDPEPQPRPGLLQRLFGRLRRG